MMDCTDRHYRAFARLLSKHVLLYSEMITAAAIIHGDRDHLLGFSAVDEGAVALQLGGSDPKQLAMAAKIAADYGYCELNLNVGCPSDRVQSGRFGACLMKTPQRVAECVSAMQSAVTLPITVKSRIGVDQQDSYDALCHFTETISQGGCQTLIVHARKAWLKGLSPRENRDIPPLRYPVVYQLKRDFPELEIIINGGIKTTEAIDTHLAQVDGVMIGREAYQHPYCLAEMDQRYFNSNNPVITRIDAIKQYETYVMKQLENGVPLRRLLRHLVGVFTGCPFAKQWRRYLSENSGQQNAGVQVLQEALTTITQNTSLITVQAS